MFSTFDVSEQTFYETPLSAAIVNLKPIVPGHVLVIPKKHYSRLADIPHETLADLFQTVQHVGKVVESAFSGDSLTVSVQDGASAGQTVDHVHVHVIPRRPGDIVPNDAIYEHLERFGLELADKTKALDSERTPRTAAQMKEEARWLAERADKTRSDRLPVTLISGFLGSGKTTLLHRILCGDHGLRIAVIVNDMGELNIDARLVAHASQGTERLVEMTNGCVCCTLRGDLLEEVSQLARDKRIDYLIIESSGISEPMQVCETFSEEFAEMHAAAAADLRASVEPDAKDAESNARIAAILEAGGLPAVARLDTCCTVVDAVSIFNDFSTADFLADRHKDVPEEDDRNISDLMVDQIEFADVVIVSKVDLVSQEQLAKVTALVKQLNPNAKVLTADHGNVPLNEILNTRRFSYERAAMSAGWLQSLQGAVPETEEYGIGSFVYRARRPFHPERLWKTVRESFVVIQEEFIDDGEDSAEEDSQASDDARPEEEPMDADDMEEAQPQLNPAARLASKRKSKVWAPLLRSKGFFWLASRPTLFGEWSQAGVMLTLSGGERWRCEIPREEWPDDPEIVAAIERDFDPDFAWGDRRQELVFIGTDMPNTAKRISRKLDSCLLTDAEWSQWEAAMQLDGDERQAALDDAFTDGFEDWVDYHHEHLEGAAGHGNEHAQCSNK
ncbi:hypothetical protein MCUN1_003519 [Malassezia cuniculi]|uniref:HIT domain-containing protein n=1 Tax=Malassezia cuniculi TaxID=948313 RepID=A0AAF0EY68_9BASI|nr:hypothetical protein MCUN1_003519 [Malassezia cuniculi]